MSTLRFVILEAVVGLPTLTAMLLYLSPTARSWRER